MQKQDFCLDHFQVIKNIGKGKFSEVFLARHKETNLIVALKILQKSYLIENRLEQQLQREIIIQSKCQHPNIVQLYGYFYDKEQIYLVMEYAPKGDLYSLLKSQTNGRFDEPMASYLIKQVIEAMIEIHSHQFIHRDLKPENLFISLNKVKIGDFGLAIEQLPCEPRKTFCGTLDYISPEMFMKKGHDQKVDVWSIGILTYELTQGRPPFEGQDMETTKLLVLRGNYQQDGMSDDLINFLQGLLEVDHRKRCTLQQAINHTWIQKYSQQ